MLHLPDMRITVTGGAGFLGLCVIRQLESIGVPSSQICVPRSAQYDLTEASHVAQLYDDAAPDVVIHLAAEVGGIGANQKQPGRFFYANMAMGLHLIEESRKHAIRKFVQVGTVCAYPKHTAVPFRESDLWNGYPEETNAPYGVAKKALFVMLDAYQRQYALPSAVVVPSNLYGPGDNFDPKNSHVIPALIRKFEEAGRDGRSTVTCWGSGNASREFLFVEDAAAAIVEAAIRHDTPEPINLGTGQEITIRALAEKIGDLCGFNGQIEWDKSKPDGQPRRCLDVSRAAALLGWSAGTSLDNGLRRTIDWYRRHASV